jgi:hypothetical protein
MFFEGLSDLDEQHEDGRNSERLQAHLVKERSKLGKNEALLINGDQLEEVDQLINLRRRSGSERVIV